MNQIASETTNVSDSNLSLITAGLPSSSKKKSPLIPPLLTQKYHQDLNQNRATDTQPMTSNSQRNDSSQCTTLSNRTVSDTYLNLSRKDINDVMTALHTLAQYVQYDVNDQTQQHSSSIDENEGDHLTMLYSKGTSHTLKSSTPVNSSSHHRPRYSIRYRRHSLSSDHCLHHRHHIKHHLNLVEEFQHDLHDMKCRQKRRMPRQLQHHANRSNYPSHSSNAILYTSTCRSTRRPKQIYHCSRQHQSTRKLLTQDQYQQSIKGALSSSIPLSSYIFDQLASIDQKEPILNIQMLPQHAHTLQILQNNHIHSLMSLDSLNCKDIFNTSIIPCRDQTSGMGDQLNSKKIDVATQWSLQKLTSSCNEMDVTKCDHRDEQENLEVHLTHTNSNILTELTESISTIPTNNSFANRRPINNLCDLELCLEKPTSVGHQLTKSMTERFLTTLNLPTCNCSTMNTTVKHSAMNDRTMCLSLDNQSSMNSPTHQKRTKQISGKSKTKRSRPHTPKSSKNNSTIKRSRRHCRSQSNDRLTTVIQSYQTTDPIEDSSLDFFDTDTAFSDTYDRLFPDPITFE